MPAGRFVFTIRARNRKKVDRPVDPLLNKMTHGVMLIFLGFFLMTAGMLMTLFGDGTRRKTGNIEAIFVIGPIVMFLGLGSCIGGGVLYGINYQKKQARERARHPDSNSPAGSPESSPEHVQPAQTSPVREPNVHPTSQSKDEYIQDNEAYHNQV